MSGYTKLFSDIVTSTIWHEPNDCRVLWITMLALKGADNICRATVPALALLANITLEECEAFLEKFQQPDKYSRSQEHEGRRIAPNEGGWMILNGAKYQAMCRAADRKDYVRERVAEHRARKKKKKLTVEQKADLPPANEHRPADWEIAPPGEAHSGSFEQYEDKRAPRD